MISSDIIRGYNDSIILSILIDGDSYGYEISKKIRTITDEKYVIKETTLYSAFSRLTKKGYIVSYPGAETFGKKKNVLQNNVFRVGILFRKRKRMVNYKRSCRSVFRRK